MPPNLTHPRRIKQNKIKEKKMGGGERTKGKISSWDLQCDTVSYTVNPFIHTSLHTGIHHEESLACSTPFTLGPHWNSFWTSCCYPVLLRSCNPRSTGPTCPTPTHNAMLQQITDGVDVGVNQYLTLANPQTKWQKPKCQRENSIFNKRSLSNRVAECRRRQIDSHQSSCISTSSGSWTST